MVRAKNLRVMELSALRQAELIPLLEALQTLDLSGFGLASRSLHTQLLLSPAWERALCELPSC